MSYNYICFVCSNSLFTIGGIDGLLQYGNRDQGYVYNPENELQPKGPEGPYRKDLENYVRPYRSPLYTSQRDLSSHTSFSKPEPIQFPSNTYSQLYPEQNKELYLETTESSPLTHSPNASPSPSSSQYYSANPSAYDYSNLYSFNPNSEVYLDNTRNIYSKPKREGKQSLLEYSRPPSPYTRSPTTDSSSKHETMEVYPTPLPGLFPTPVSYTQVQPSYNRQHEEREDTSPPPFSISGPTLSSFHQPSQDMESLNPTSAYPPTQAAKPRINLESSDPRLANPDPTPGSYPEPTQAQINTNPYSHSNAQKHRVNSKPYSRSYSKQFEDSSFTNPGILV